MKHIEMSKKYYSQFGEDKFLDEKGNLPDAGVFVDVGAGGVENSNSLFFEEKGWLCLCIEPDKRYSSLKDRQLVDHSVVGAENGKADFVYHHYPQLSGLYHDKATAVSLSMFTLDTILERHKIDHIDILSIDVEGHEDAVLDGFSIEKYHPWYIIIEYTNQFKGNKEADIRKRLMQAGYEQIHRTQSNLIMKFTKIE